ncbi:MAG: DUF1439 domain-containing protein [Burkholderiaceae bacterium]
MQRRHFLVPVLAAGTTFVAGCALFGPRTVDVSQAQLEELLARRFPLTRRVLEIFDVTVSAPRLRLLPEANRIATDFDLTSTDRLLRAQHRGALALSFGLRFEATDNTLRATQVRVERLQIDGAPALLQRQVERLGTLLAEQALDDQVVHTLRQKDVEAVQGRGYRLGELRVTPHGLRVTLLPIEPR